MYEHDYVRWLLARVGHVRVILVYTAFIPDQQGRVLLQRRSDFPWWGLPGGVLERGERPEECLVREVREETGRRAVGGDLRPDGFFPPDAPPPLSPRYRILINDALAERAVAVWR